MGTYFTAVVNHNLDEHNIYTLPDLLNSTWHTVEHVLPIEGSPGLVRHRQNGSGLKRRVWV